MAYHSSANPSAFARFWQQARSGIQRLCVLGDSRMHVTSVNALAEQFVAALARRFGPCPETPHLSYADYANVQNSVGTMARIQNGATASPLLATNRPPTLFAHNLVYHSTPLTILFDHNRSASPALLLRGVPWFDVTGGVKARLWFLTKSGSSAAVTVTHQARNDTLPLNTTATASYTTDLNLSGSGDGQLVSWTSPLLAYNASKPQFQVGVQNADPSGATSVQFAGWQFVNPAATSGVAVDYFGSYSGFGTSLRSGAYMANSLMGSRDNAAHWGCYAAKGYDAFLILLSVNDAGPGNAYTAAEYAAGAAGLIAKLRATMTAVGKSPLFFLAIGPYVKGSDWTAAETTRHASYYAQCVTQFAAANDVKVIDLISACAAMGCNPSQVDALPSGTTDWASGQSYVVGDQVIYKSTGAGTTLRVRCIANHTANGGNYPGAGDGTVWAPVESWHRDGIHPTALGALQLAESLVAEMVAAPTLASAEPQYVMASAGGTLPASDVRSDTTTGQAAGGALAIAAEGSLGDLIADLYQRVQEQVPTGPVSVIAQAPAGQTTLHVMCYDEHGAPQQGVVITIRCKGVSGNGKAYTGKDLTAVSDAVGLAQVGGPRGTGLTFSARRGDHGDWVTFNGVDAETLEMPSILGRE